MKTRHLRDCCRWILLIGALAMLSGCDGGIFGTGDGDLDVSVDNAGTESPDSQPPAGSDTSTEDVSEPGSPDASPDSSTGDPDDAAQVEIRPFENLETGSIHTQPVIALVNLSSQSLNAIAETELLFADAIEPGIVSNYTSVALETTQLSIIDGATSQTLLNLSPLNLGAFSASTLIARDRLATDTSESGDPFVEIIAIASQLKTSDDGVARVRLLQASPLDEDDEPASMSLVPADTSPGGSEVELGTLSAANFGVSTDYRLATAGSYRLMDSLGRLAPLSVELVAGEFHTLILTGSPVQLRMLRDSQSAARDESSTNQQGSR